MIPPVYDESEIPERLRRLLAMEIARIFEDLEERRGFLLEVWSRHRDRGPLLDTVFSRWRTLSMADLALIDSEAIVACEAFYRDLEELRLYFQFTQDMPTTMDDQYGRALERIAATGELAVRLLGGVPPRPGIELADRAPPPPRLSLLAPVEPEPEPEPDGDGGDGDGGE